MGQLPFWIAILFAPAVSAAQSTAILEPHQPVERELRGGQSHSYHFDSAANQFVDLIVEQRYIDVIVVLTSPDGAQLAEAAPLGRLPGPEPLSVLLDKAGRYKVEVRAATKAAVPGHYRISLAERRPALSSDRPP